jgi:hypothetical protein
MLLEFSVANFLSFKEKKTISLISSGISDYKDNNIFDTERYSVLKGAVIYGANSIMNRLLSNFWKIKLRLNPYWISIKHWI